MTTDAIDKYDTWLGTEGPAALVIREHLMPVEGYDGVVFPATYAPSEDKSFKGGYNIDAFADGTNICLVDSVGSQANRIEPLFATKKYAGLVPQVVIKAGSKLVNLLDAGHRAGDAIVRCSALKQELQDAFRAVLQQSDATALAKIAPTSLVFGVWDSRDTQAKLPRLVSSTIRAYNVVELKRSAQFVPAVEYVAEGLLDDTDDKKARDAYSVRGFIHVPASAAPGGVLAKGGIRREAALHIAALRLLMAGQDEAQTLALRRYVLGLALTAITYSPLGYLRQGCNLVPDPEKPREFSVVHADGHREDATITHVEALAFAQIAASRFGIDPSRDTSKKAFPDREIAFDAEMAKIDVAGDAEADSKKQAKIANKKTKDAKK